MGVQNASACELSTVTCTVTSCFLLPIGDFIVQGSRKILCQQAQHGVHTSVFKVFATCFLQIQSHKKVAIVVDEYFLCALRLSDLPLVSLSHFCAHVHSPQKITFISLNHLKVKIIAFISLSARSCVRKAGLEISLYTNLLEGEEMERVNNILCPEIGHCYL